MTKFSLYEIKDLNTNSWFCISPERGGLVTNLGLNGEEVLYLDEETFYDERVNVRGGIPILFPACDRLEQEQYKIGNQLFKMGNHGFARNLPWVIKEVDEKSYSITIELNSTEATKIQYPFDFKLTFKFQLCDGAFTIYQSYENYSNYPMPFYAGFHPYFKAQQKHGSYGIYATKYLDVNDGQVKSFEGELDITTTEEALILLDSKDQEITFPFNSKKKLSMQYSKEFKYVTLWSQPGKPFLCIEPWMGKPNSFNTKEDLQYVEENKALHAFLTIAVQEN